LSRETAKQKGMVLFYSYLTCICAGNEDKSVLSRPHGCFSWVLPRRIFVNSLLCHRHRGRHYRDHV